jgi:ligand-binding sensor domain-containing protein
LTQARHIILLLLVTVVSLNLRAQDPHLFYYDDENGLPSNEVYSIVQDQKGFIWFGCDAGLYKFDGVRYIPYKCDAQKTKSASGLTVSVSGKVYCTNFQSQIFYVENDVLKELPHTYSHILHIICDSKGNLLVNHRYGFAVYNEAEKNWKNYTGFSGNKVSEQATRSARVNPGNETCFLTASGICIYKNKKFYHTTNFSGAKPPVALSSDFVIEWVGKEQWIFPFSTKRSIYKARHGQIDLVTSKNLLKAVAGKTITNVKRLADGKLWICTYSGIIRYDPLTDHARVYYSNLAFSECLIDREGNYWFSTLQSGLIRIPNLNYLVWNSFPNYKITRLTSDGKQIYFAMVNGGIGQINTRTNEVSFLQRGTNSSIQTLTYSAEDDCVHFYTEKNIYSLKNRAIQLLFPNVQPTKHLLKMDDDYLICSSLGTYIHSNKSNPYLECLNDLWAREGRYDRRNKILWLATNSGLLRYEKIAGHWKLKRTLFPDKQILSIDLDPVSGRLFAVTFKGELYSIQKDNSLTRLYKSSGDVQSYRVLYHKQKVYVATNRGVWVFNLKTGKLNTLQVFSGLASNNVQDLTIVDETLWLGTGKGLQKVPLKAFHSPPKVVVYLKNEPIHSKRIQLDFGQPFFLYPEVNGYSGNGNYQYAYRINSFGDWTKLPGSIDQIQLQNIPSGNFEIELKAIDHLGRDSKNTLLIKGYSSPPFWFTWWFILLEIALFLGMVFFIFRRQLAKRQIEFNKQQELAALKLTAIKSQMNPHFIFNVLSSIKGYIYENDRQKATAYLDDFSDFMRTVLEMSEVHYISIADELKLLKLYIDLEAMMLESFSYEIQIGDDLNTNAIKIPSLVLQPYIENAFKHGLRHKQGEKKMLIKISRVNEKQTAIELIDNGIGRMAATELNANNALKRQSFATRALEKRMALINRQSEQKIQLEVIDLLDESGNSAGTSILLTLKHDAV